MEALKLTLDSLRQRRAIPEEVAGQIFKDKLPRAIFSALSAIYNLAIPASAVYHDHSARQVVALEQLTIAVGSLNSLPEPSNYLANFRKDLFYECCRKGEKYRNLLNKIYGLYPLIDVTTRVPLLLKYDAEQAQTEQVGNPHWLLTRKVNAQWLEQARNKLSKQAAYSCYILQADVKLLQSTKDSQFWDLLWALLYLWLNRVFLDPHHVAAGGNSKATWCTLSDSELWARVKSEVSLVEDKLNAEEKTLAGLVLFGVEEHLISQGVSKAFELVVNSYCSISLKSWQQLLILHLIRQTSIILRHDQLAAKCSNRLQQATNQDFGVQSSPQLQYLLPHLLRDKETLIRYLVDRRLDFWSYGLQRQVTEEIAKECLWKLMQFTEDQRPFVLTHLPPSYFIQQILASQLQVGQKRTGKNAIRTILRSISLQAAHIHSHLRLSRTECQQNLKLFSTQWDSYYALQTQGISTSNYRACQEFLGFNKTTLSIQFQREARLPQQIPSIFQQIVSKITKFLLKEGEGSVYCISGLLFDRCFAQRLESMSEQSRRKIWSDWADLMVREEQVMEQLMGVE